MKRYYIGILVLAIIALVLTGFVLVQGTKSKQDVQTAKKAQEIAGKLNSYVEVQNKIPASLSEAKITDVPDTITYKKSGANGYEFCEEYNAASNFGGSGISNTLSSAFFSRYATSDNYGGGASGLGPDSYKPSSLYPSASYHKKGQNCQTIEPIVGSGANLDSNSSNYLKTICADPMYASLSYCSNGGTDFGSTLTN